MSIVICPFHGFKFDTDYVIECPLCEVSHVSGPDLGDDVPRTAGRSDDGGEGDRIGLGGHPRQVQAGRAAREADCVWRST